jgi:hypothetical protein
MNLCIKSIYFALGIWTAMECILIGLGIYYAKENRKIMLIMIITFKIIMWMTIPLLLLITSGVC